MQNAAVYVRSSKDRSDISLAAQKRELSDLATTKGLTISCSYEDAVYSGSNEDRPHPRTGAEAVRYRQSGRTTRMLAAAVASAIEGRAVYVLVASNREADRMRGLLSNPQDLGIKFETLDTLPMFDWKTLRSVGMHPNCEVFIDHYAIEAEFPLLVRALRRYEEQKP